MAVVAAVQVCVCGRTPSAAAGRADTGRQEGSQCKRGHGWVQPADTVSTVVVVVLLLLLLAELSLICLCAWLSECLLL
jgi:hypothetical protein